MAFCTHCGANVDGAFCSQCGKPVEAAAAASPAAAPPRRKTSVLVWILVVILGLALVAGLAAVAGGFWIAHKVREAGVDPELFRENPSLAIGKLISAAHPDTEVVRADVANGTVTLRDRNTGKQMTLTFDQVRKGDFRFEANDGNGKGVELELNGDASNIPADVPIYPGAKVRSRFAVDGDGDKGQGAYEYEFTTADSPAKVLDYYHRRLEDDGMNLALSNHTADGGMLVAEDDPNHRTLRVIVNHDDGGTTINLTSRVKR